MVSKALVVGAYQRKLEELGRHPDINLSVIVPAGWREGRDTIRLERAHTDGYELIVAPLVLNGSFHLHYYPTLGRLLRGLRPDLLHMDEEPYNLATWHALRLGRTVGARCLFFTWQNLERRYPWPFRHFEAANYRRASHAIAGNQAAASVLRAKGYRGPLAVIPQFGVDPDLFSPTPPADPDGVTRQPERTPRFTIGYAGRLVPEKGIDILLQACAGLPFREWTLHLRGEGTGKAGFEVLAAELGISSRVHFLGRMPSTQVAEYYRTLDVLVLPSVSQPNWAEQFGRVLIEAMACGVPVVGSDSGEIPHVIGDAGIVFPERDVEALGAALASLASSQEYRATLAGRGRARVLAHYTQEQVAAATAKVYRKMLS